MADLSLQELTEAGDDVTLNTPNAGGDTAPNPNGDTFLVLDNSGGSAATCSVTITSNKTTFNSPAYGPSQKASITINLDANDKKIAGKFAKVPFNDSNGKLALSYGGDITGLTVGVCRVTK